MGYLPLRKAICDYVSRSRAVRCDPDQVVITSGAQQALYLCAKTLLDAGESVWMEDPGYPRARVAFASAGLRLIPVPVDSDGLDVAAGIKFGYSANQVGFGWTNAAFLDLRAGLERPAARRPAARRPAAEAALAR